MKYLEEIFNIKIKYQSIKNTEKIPYYIKDLNELKYATINGIKTIFMYPCYDKNGAEKDAIVFNYNSIKQQIQQLFEIFHLPIVLILDSINAYQRNLLIRNSIPFVVPNKQAYLPFMGVSLMESYSKNNLKLISPSTQMIFLYCVYLQNKLVYLSDIEEALKVNKMTVTRAFKELSFFDGITLGKDGVKRTLIANKAWKDIFIFNINLQINPVNKKVYLERNKFCDIQNTNFVYSGGTAISKYTMINEPKYTTFATSCKIQNIADTHNTLEDPKNQICIELWRYDPTKLAKLFFDNQYVDILSLYLATDPFSDDRIDKELEVAFNKFWKEYDA